MVIEIDLEKLMVLLMAINYPFKPPLSYIMIKRAFKINKRFNDT